MAKKVNNELDELDLDADLDAFDFDFPDPNKPDDRKPVTKFKSGLKEGLKTASRDPKVIKGAIKEALPRGFGQVLDESDRAAEALRNLYDEGAKQIRPVVAQSKRLATKLVPTDSKLVPKVFQDMVKRWREEEKSNSGARFNEDRESQMAANLAEIFGKQAVLNQQIAAQEQATDKVRDGIASVRHRDMLTLLNRISVASSTQANYTTNVADHYYRRSLELQYRSVWAMQDLTKQVAEDAARSRELLDAVVKNTGLPDAIKATGKEARAEMAKRALYQSVNNGLFASRNQTIEGVISGISKKLQETISSAASSAAMGLAGVEMGIDMSEGMGDKHVIAGKLIGEQSAGFGINKLSGVLGKKLRDSKLGQRLQLEKRGKRLENAVSNMPRRIEEFRTDNKYMWDDSIFGSFMTMLQGVMPTSGVATNVEHAGLKDMNSPYYITRRTDRSLNEAIPGYLARIWREVRILRTGDAKTPLVVYDFGRGRFTGDNTLRQTVKEQIIPARNVARTQENLDEILQQVDPNNTMSPEAREALKRRLLINSSENKLASRERLADSKAYDSNPTAAAEAAAAMEQFFSTADDDTLHRFSKTHNRLASDIGDTRDIVQQHIEAGNAQQLRALGLVDDDVKKIDLRKVLDYYLASPNSGPMPPASGSGFPGAPPGVPPGAPPGFGPNDGPKPNAALVAKNALTTVSESVRNAGNNVGDQIKAAATFAQTPGAVDELLGKIGNGVEARKNYAVAVMKQQLPSDIYVGNETVPRIQKALLESGQYFNKSSGDVITTIAELGDTIIDRHGNVVLRANEIGHAFAIDSVKKKAIPLLTFSGVAATAKHAETQALEVSSQISAGVRNMAKLAMDAGRDHAKRMVSDIKAKAEDLYVQGEEKPRVTAAEMQAGQVLNEQGKPVLDTSHITGDLFTTDGQIRLRKEELDKVIYFDRSVAKWSPLWIAGRLGKAIWNYQTQIAPGMAWRNLKRLGSAYKTVGGALLRGAKWALGFRVNNFPQDCYTRGGIHPVLFGVVMKNGGYFSANTGKQILTPAQIDGAVIDANKQYVLTEEQYKDGLYNIDGRKISTTALGRLIKATISFPFKVAGKAAGWVSKGAWAGVKAGADAVGEVGKFGLRTLGAGARGLGYAMGIRYEGNDDERAELARKRRAARGDASATDENLSQNKLKNLSLDQATAAVHGKFGRIRSLFGLNRSDAVAMQSAGLLNGIYGLLKKQDEEKDEDSTSPVAKKRRRTGLLAAARSLFQRKKEDASGKKESKPDKEEDKDGDGMSLSDAKAGWDLLKDTVKGAKGAAGKLGSLGMKYGGKLLTLGGLIGGGATAVAGSGAGAAAAGAATAAEAAAVTGGAAASGGILASLSAAATAAGTAIATALSSPVVIGAAAAALLGYGGYKAYKYFTRGRLSAIGKLRVTQYGFKADDSTWAKRMVDLESMVVPAVSLDKEGKPIVDWNKLKANKLMEAVGLDPTNIYQRKPFTNWMKGRFLPVLYTHLTAAQALAGKMDLEAPEDLKGEERKKYINAVAFQEGPYGLSDLPVWPVGSQTPTNAQDVAAAYAAALEDLKESAKSVVQKAVEAVVPSAQASVKPTTPEKKLQLPNDETLTAGRLSMSAASQIGVNALSDGSRVDALEAVRMKAYGLVELSADKVQALRLLEKLVSSRVNINSRDGKANWSDDVQYLMGRVATNFGISETHSEAGQNWIKWFNQRFIPVYLTYQTGFYAKTGKAATIGADGTLKPRDQLEIGKLIAATQGIWSITTSPWSNYALSSNADAINVNLKFIEELAGKAVLEEQKRADTGSKPSPSGAAKPQTKPADVAKQAGEKAVAAVSAPDAENNAKATGGGGTTASSGQTPSEAGGPLADGRGASGYMKLGTGVTLDGLNDQFKQQLLGAIEEYGNQTGKQVTINDGFRTYADQVARKRKYGAGAAAPGNSIHEFGMAVDINQATLNEMDKLGLLRKYGLTRPVGQEPWHLEPIGIQDNLALYKEDTDAATQAIKNGIGRGGGGWGTVASAGKYTRNADHSRTIASANTQPTESQTGMLGSIAALPPRDQGIIRRSGVTGTPVTIPDVVRVPGGRVPSGAEAAKTAAARQAGGGVYTAAGKTLMASNDAEFDPRSSGTSGPGVTASDPTFKVPDPKGSGVDGLRDTIIGAAKVVGVNPDYLMQTIAVESDFKSNAAAGTSSAQGLGQFTRSTWLETIRKYGAQYGYDANTDPSDPKASALMTAHYLKDNLNGLKATGSPTVLDAYLAHFMGLAGANRFLSEMQRNPNAIASQVFPAAAKANQSIFYTADGRARTLMEVYIELGNRLKAKAKAYGLSDPAVTPPAIQSPMANQPTAGAGMPQIVPPRIPGVVQPTRPTGPVSMGPVIRPPVSVGVPTVVPSDRGAMPPQTSYTPELINNAASAIIEQLSVQRQILEVVKTIANKSGEATSVTSSQKPAPVLDESKQSETSYSVPPVPVPMRRSM